MRVWADVSNAAGDIQGDGPITAIESASISRALDGPGELSVTVPLGDERSLALLQNERRVALWQELPSSIISEDVESPTPLPAVDISASSPGPDVSTGPENAFDGLTTTEWITTTDDWVDKEAWIQWSTGTAKRIRRYIMQAPFYAGYAPTAWAFQAYENGQWVTIEQRSGITWSSNQQRSFTLPQPYEGGSAIVRLLLTENSENRAGIKNIRLYQAVAESRSLPTPPRSLGRGIVRLRNGSEAAGSRALTVSGPDQLEELRRANTLLGRIYDGELLADVIDDLVSLASGWTVDTSTVAAQVVYARFDGASVLKALQEIAARYGYHFRLSGDREITFGPLGDAAPLRIIQAGHALTETLETNDDVALIETLQWTEDSEAVANWIIPVGGGEGEAALTLAHSERPNYRAADWEPSGNWTSALNNGARLSETNENHTRLAMRFRPAAACNVQTVFLWMRKTGSPTGTMTLQLQTSLGGGTPTGTPVTVNATTTKTEASLPTGVFTRIRFDFPAPIPLAGNTRYHLVLTTTRAPSAANYVEWLGTSSGGPSDGLGLGYDGAWGFINFPAVILELSICVLAMAPGETRRAIETVTGPDGTTLYYLRDTTSIADHGEIRRVFTSDIAPVSNGNMDKRNAANALYDAAHAWLDRYAVTQTVYNCTLAKVYQDLQPGQLVRLAYKGYVTNADGDPIAWRDVDDDFWVVRVTETHSNTGPATQVELSNIDRARQDMSSLIVGALEAVSLKNVTVQPYPAVFSYVYTDFVQNYYSAPTPHGTFDLGKRASFAISIDDTVTEILRVKVKVKTRPLYTLTLFDPYSNSPKLLYNYAVLEGSNYPGRIAAYLNGTDITAALGGPWQDGAGENSEWEEEFDLTDMILAAGGQGNHLLEFESSSRTGGGSDSVQVAGHEQSLTLYGSSGVVECTINIYAIVQAIKV